SEAGRRSPCEGRLPLLRAEARQGAPLLHGGRGRVPPLPRRARLRRMIAATTRIVALIGHPVAHSLSPRMQNAAFAALALDWAYVALDVPSDRLAEAVRGLAASGFAGANVTAPHKLAVAELVGADTPSVNTLVFRDGTIEAHSTDAAILDGVETKSPVVLGSGGAAFAFLEALPNARGFARSGEWPPDVRDADLVVNATTSRDDVLVELAPGQTLAALPYP